MRYTSLRVINVDAGAGTSIETGDEELILVPLAGSASVSCDGSEYQLEGRESVFSGPSDFCYLPIGRAVTVESQDGIRFALCGAKTDRELEFRYSAAADVPIELRGAGRSSRLVRNFGTVGVFETAKLIACEVLTPDGNWSSYPAHKHDHQSELESELEELYYFEIADGPNGEPGFGYMQTTASDDRQVALADGHGLVEVRQGSMIEVPYGWHGPCVAAPGFDMYYLNAMAGPGAERAWLITDHPDHAFVRASWDDQQIDPRLERRR